jgi:tetratricopeptide (TPR) repeat protein
MTAQQRLGPKAATQARHASLIERPTALTHATKPPADQILKSALRHHKAGRRRNAIAAYRRALEIQPNHRTALANLATLILERGFTDEADFDGAIDVCRRAIDLLLDPAPAQAVLGRLLLASGRAEEAAVAYRAVLAHAPANIAARTGLALSLVRIGAGEEALGAANAVLAASPNFIDAWYARGVALLLVQQPVAAAQAFEHGLSLAPEEARMHLGLGDAYAELDRDAEAIAHLLRAAELDPASKWAHANLGSVLYRRGDLANAEVCCRQALALDPQMSIAHRNLAGILEDKGDLDQARQHRDAAYRLNSLTVSRAARPRASVLVLTTSGSGNIPYRRLLPPGLYTRIEWFIEYAPEGQAAELPAYDVVFNVVGDPDYSEATDGPVMAFLRTSDRPVLNHPAKVTPTRRDRLPMLLAGVEGLAVPAVERLEAEATFDVSRPVLVRPIGSHGGAGLFLARAASDLEGVDLSGGAYVTEFHDFRSPDGRYRKYRIIFVDGRPYPYHLAVADDWLVHYWTSGMEGDAVRQAEELRFLEDPRAALGMRAWDAVAAVGERLGLDYAGIDFSVLPDGRALVFEANATMLVHPEADGELAYKNPFVERIFEAFRSMIDRRAS